jgi:3-deoxy-7-phosphoheptulonate synthase
MSRIANPIGSSSAPSATPEQAIELCETLEPAERPGRLTLVSRMGNTRSGRAAADRREGHRRRLPRGLAVRPDARQHRRVVQRYKTRHFDRIVDEVLGYFDVHRELRDASGRAARRVDRAKTSPSASAARRRSSTPTSSAGTRRPAIPA